MKKISPPHVLAVLATLAGTNLGIAMENHNEQKQYFETAMSNLKDLGKNQKEEAAVIGEITKKTIKLETLEKNIHMKLDDVLTLTPEKAKEEAYKLAAKMDKKSVESDRRTREIFKAHEKRNGETKKSDEDIRNEENAEKHSILMKNYRTKNSQSYESKLMEHEKKRDIESKKTFGEPCPSLILNFGTTPYIGIGHYLFFKIMEDRYQQIQISTPIVLKALEDNRKFRQEWTQRAKNDFIKSYSVLNKENKEAIKEIAEMQGIKLFDAAK